MWLVGQTQNSTLYMFVEVTHVAGQTQISTLWLAVGQTQISTLYMFAEVTLVASIPHSTVRVSSFPLQREGSVFPVFELERICLSLCISVRVWA